MERGVDRNLGLVLLCSALSLFAGGAIVYFSLRAQQPATPVVISTPLPTSTTAPSPTPAPIRVYVSGAVQRSAVYELPSGSIVQAAIDAAGGPSSEADLASVNLALELKDQQHVHVPTKGEADPPPVVSGGASRTGEGIGLLVDINAATAAELERLPGVGEVTAQRIVAYRDAHGPFQVIEDIQNVSGIGPKTFEGFQAMITAGQ